MRLYAEIYMQFTPQWTDCYHFSKQALRSKTDYYNANLWNLTTSAYLEDKT
jgi:hypothetical protein